MDNNFTFFYIHNSFPNESTDEFIYDFSADPFVDELLSELPEYNPSDEVLDNLFKMIYLGFD